VQALFEGADGAHDLIGVQQLIMGERCRHFYSPGVSS
jgi:hypothetical protein